MLVKLDAVDSETGVGSLSPEDITLIRRQLAESQTLVRETVERLRQSQEENEMITRRRDEVESRLAALEAEYEELLEKTINDEETSNVDVAESMAELKVCLQARQQQILLTVHRRASLKHSMRLSAMPTKAKLWI